MNLTAVSPFENASEAEILAFLARATAALILLPGWSRNMPSPKTVQGIIRPGVSLFLEAQGNKKHATPYLVTSRELISMPRQIFATRPTAEDIENLAKALPNRTFPIGSRTVTFFICGEILAFNPDGSIKHGGQLSYDIVANPVHTLMGHWNHLDKKLSSLSQNSVVLYAANNNRNHSGISTDVRIYKHGRRLASRYSDGKIAWCQCEI